jgi:hypothetical protein
MIALGPRQRILRVALSLGAFALGLDALVAIGALDEISRDREISARAGGWIISRYAFCSAWFAPLNARRCVSYRYLVPIQHRWLGCSPGRSTLVLAVNSSLVYKWPS